MTPLDRDAVTHERRHPGRFLVAAIAALVLPRPVLTWITPAVERWVWGRRVTRP